MCEYKKPNIAIIGAGFTLFDENDEIGGTWFRNTYPGCECDIPAYIYSYSFETNPGWSKLYAGQKEILEYLKSVAAKHRLYEKIKFQHQVLSAEWNELYSHWEIKVRNMKLNLDELHVFDIIIVGTGTLRAPNHLELFQPFRNTKIHSAEWNSSVDLNGKVVAIVGTGSSAAQIIPSLVDKVKRLVVYQRHPAWVIPKLQIKIPRKIQWLINFLPGMQRVIRHFLIWIHDMIFPAFFTHSWMSKLAAKLAKWNLCHQVLDLEKRKMLVPTDDIGCKRILMSNDYYSALNKGNVTIVTSKIIRVTHNTIVTVNGREEMPDVLITATGFKTQDYFAPLIIKGKCGEDLNKKWQVSGPISYLGIVCSSAPNAFFILGPNAILAHNSIVTMIEYQVNWMIQIIQELIKRNARKVTVRVNAEMEYMDSLNALIKLTVWGNGNCTSWYTNQMGNATVLWPERLSIFQKRSRNPIFSHLDFE